MLWRKTLIYWRSIAVAGVIVYACLLREPSVALPPIQGIDKYIHAFMYLVLALMLQWDSKATEWSRSADGNACFGSWQWWFVTIGLPAILGGSIEVLQEKYFYPRTGDWMDWVANCIGIAAGVIIWWIGLKWHERRMAK